MTQVQACLEILEEGANTFPAYKRQPGTVDFSDAMQNAIRLQRDGLQVRVVDATDGNVLAELFRIKVPPPRWRIYFDGENRIGVVGPAPKEDLIVCPVEELEKVQALLDESQETLARTERDLMLARARATSSAPRV